MSSIFWCFSGIASALEADYCTAIEVVGERQWIVFYVFNVEQPYCDVFIFLALSGIKTCFLCV